MKRPDVPALALLERTALGQEEGASIIEVLVTVFIMATLMGAISGMFSTAVKQYSSEQGNAAVVSDARAAIDLMSLEIAQAGSHREVPAAGASPVLTLSPILSSVSAQAVAVSSSVGFEVGDWVDFSIGPNTERVQIVGVGTNALAGVFRVTHPPGVPVRLFAQPYFSGILPPAGMAANSSATATVLRFFGDINADGKVCYVEYRYDADNSRITRSSTPITAANMNPAETLIQNVKADSAQFTLYSDVNGAVTSVDVAFTVTSRIKTGSKYQETPLSAKVAAPSVVAASALSKESLLYASLNHLPPTPSKVLTWSYQ
jgi:hypothetical protein